MRKFVLALAAILLSISGFAFVSAASANEKPWICHPVNGNGELGTGWNLINPDKASSHIDESLYPDGVYWKHEAKDGRHDVYSVGGKCPGEVVPPDDEPTDNPTPTEPPVVDPPDVPDTSVVNEPPKADITYPEPDNKPRERSLPNTGA